MDRAFLVTCGVRLAVGGLCLGLVLGVTPGPALATGDGMSPRLVAAEVAPALQLVQVQDDATVVVRHFSENTAAVSAATRHLQAEQADGQLGSSRQAINDQWATDLARDPGRYYHPTSATTVLRVKVLSTCTGWFATPTGYLVTAAHCVSRPAAIPDVLAQAAATYVPAERKTLLASWQASGVPIDQTISASLARAVAKWFSRHSMVSSLTTRATIALSVAGSGDRPGYRVMPATIVAVGTPYPGPDYSVLKVSGYRHLPSLALGHSAGLSVGDNLYIDGFPGTITGDSFFTIRSRLQPTFTDGLLSALRTTTGNVPYLQTQAPAYHGNSGGPVLDSSGHVVGILIAGSVDQSTGQMVAGEQFVLPSATLAQLLARHGLQAVASPVTTGYIAGVRAYDRGYYARALADLRPVLTADPQHPYAAWYAQRSREQIAAGHDRTPRPPSAAFPDGLAIGIVLALAIATLVLLTIRFRRRPAALTER